MENGINFILLEHLKILGVIIIEEFNQKLKNEEISMISEL